MSVRIVINQASTTGTPVIVSQETTTEVANTPELLTTPGAGNWTKPAGVTKVLVECWGGGGGGGGAGSTNSFGGGGAGGQYSRKTITYPSAQQTISYTIGNGGTGGIGAGAATVGGDTTWETNVVVAKGGAAGTSNNLNGFPVQGGVSGSTSGGIGDVVYAGGNGAGGYYDPGTPSVQSGAGGGGAGSTGKGCDATYYSNNINTPDYGGYGGSGVIILSGRTDGSAPIAGFTPNVGVAGGGGGAGKTSGGGAAGNATGGLGTQGLIIVTTYSTTTVGGGSPVIARQ